MLKSIDNYFGNVYYLVITNVKMISQMLGEVL
jgi:hypothetical protein